MFFRNISTTQSLMALCLCGVLVYAINEVDKKRHVRGDRPWYARYTPARPWVRRAAQHEEGDAWEAGRGHPGRATETRSVEGCE